MAKDLFGGLGGLGGLVKGLGAFMPKDDLNTKVFQAQSEINDLENQEQELYVEIGKKVFPSICQKPEYTEIVQKLALIQKNLQAARLELQKAETEKAEKERLEQDDFNNRTCPTCSTLNPEGVKFCQECGAKLGANKKNKCPNCSSEYPVGTRFCGECGTKLE